MVKSLRQLTRCSPTAIPTQAYPHPASEPSGEATLEYRKVAPNASFRCTHAHMPARARASTRTASVKASVKKKKKKKYAYDRDDGANVIRSGAFPLWRSRADRLGAGREIFARFPRCDAVSPTVKNCNFHEPEISDEQRGSIPASFSVRP